MTDMLETAELVSPVSSGVVGEAEQAINDEVLSAEILNEVSFIEAEVDLEFPKLVGATFLSFCVQVDGVRSEWLEERTAKYAKKKEDGIGRWRRAWRSPKKFTRYVSHLQSDWTSVGIDPN